RSYVHGTGSSTFTAPVKLGTIVETFANWIGFSVSAHRDVSPKRSDRRAASSAEYRRFGGSIRIWHRNAMAWIGVPVVSAMRSANDRVGAAAYRSAVAPTQSNTNSAISASLRPRRAAPAQVVDECRDGLARLVTAVETFPSHTYLADQRVASIDGCPDRVEPGVRAVYEDRLYVGPQRAEQRVLALEARPLGEIELALRGTARARIAADDAIEFRVDEEERRADRHLQCIPVT